jgi:hypothetical protein
MKRLKKIYIQSFFFQYKYVYNFLIRNKPVYSFFFANYYIFIVSFFFKFLYYYFFFKYIFFKKKINLLLSKITYTFKKRNSFLNLRNNYFISYGFFRGKKLNKRKNYIFFQILRIFLFNIVYLLNKRIDLYYSNISKKILFSYNFSTRYFKRYNKKIFKVNYLKINNIFIKEKKIFGYMRKKKYPRRKKYLKKRTF